MKYKIYGKTGKNVSVVGFGGMRFDESLSHKENAELVRYANSKGINYFDTAPGYCSDTSEDIYGEAFKDIAGTVLCLHKRNALKNSIPRKKLLLVLRNPSNEWVSRR